MKEKMYCICSGSYSDWHIDHVFKSKVIRDKVFEKLNYGEGQGRHNYDSYSKCEYEIEDNNFDVDNCRDITYVDCTLALNECGYETKFYFDIINSNTVKNQESELTSSAYCEFYNRTIEIRIRRIINNSDNGNIDETSLKDKYLKICRDYYSTSKYLKEVNGLNKNQINEVLFK